MRNKHPGRFAVVKPVDPADPKVADTIADWKKTPGTVGIRIMMAAGPLVAPDDPGVNRVLAAAAKHSLPVNVLSWGRVEQLGPLARNPNTRIVVDQLQPPQTRLPGAFQQVPARRQRNGRDRSRELERTGVNCCSRHIPFG